MSGPLQGITIVDCSLAGVGPWACMTLGWLGARVIKVEGPQGDLMAEMPPFKQEISVPYLACNLNKERVHADLTKNEDRQRVYALLREADVLVENMRPGVAERLGIGPKDVAGVNPQCVYVRCPGWGESGPMRRKANLDPFAQAFSGAVEVTGDRDEPGEFLRYYALFDLISASYLVSAVLLGLISRKQTGQGYLVSNSQLGACVAAQLTRISEYLATGTTPPRLGSGCSYVVPSEAFRCEDGRYIAVVAETQDQWEHLCEAIDKPGLAGDPRFATNPDRVKNRTELVSLLQEAFGVRPYTWSRLRLTEHQVPFAPFYDWETLRIHRQIEETEGTVMVRIPGVGELNIGRLPMRFSRTPVATAPAAMLDSPPGR